MILPLKRGSKCYETLQTEPVLDYRGNEIARVSLAPNLLIQDAMGHTRSSFERFRQTPIREFLAELKKAGEVFMYSNVPIGGVDTSPEEYDKLATLSTGLPITSVTKSRWMIAQCLGNLEKILDAQSPNGGFGIYDSYVTGNIAFTPKGRNLGVVCPSNHPAANILWIIAYSTKRPVVLKPSKDDLFTPLRIVESIYQSEVPEDSLYFFPTRDTQSFVDDLFKKTDQAIIFGSEQTVNKYRGNGRIKAYGPGRSKMVIDGNTFDNGELVDVIYRSMMEDGGRGCINASCVISTNNAEDLSRAVAERVAQIEPIEPLDPKAKIAAIKDRRVAEGINQLIESSIGPDCRDITQDYRGGERLVQKDGITYLLPTVLLMEPGNPLYGAEFPFPFLTITEVRKERIPEVLGHSLTVSALTEDKALIDSLLLNPSISKVYVGNYPTSDIDLTEPHEGFITDFLFDKKAYRNGLVKGNLKF